jgi:phage gpG-like protein
MLKMIISPATYEKLKTLARDLNRVQSALARRQSPHRKIRDRMVERWAINFDSEGGQYSALWPEHKDSTIDLWGPPNKMLNRTGALRAGFIAQAKTPTIAPDATRWNFQAKPAYLFAQHFGRPDNKLFNPNGANAPIPARPIWGIDNEDAEMAKEELEKYVDEVIAKHFS